MSTRPAFAHAHLEATPQPGVRERVGRIPPPVVVLIVAPLVFLARGTLPSLAYDDSIFAAGGGLFDPYSGYLQLIPRLVWLVNVWWLGWLVALVTAAFVAGYAADRHGLIVGLAVLVLPGTIQVLGLLAGLQWYGAMFLVLWTGRQRWAAIPAVLFGLSGPFSLLLAPLLAIRRPWGWQAVVATGAIQLVTLLATGRGSSHPFDLQVLAFRGIAGPYLGTTASNWLSTAGIPDALGVAGILVLGALTLYAALTARDLWPIFAAGGLLAVLGALLAGEPARVLLMGAGSRYFLVLGLALTIYATTRVPRLPALAIGALLVIGMVADFTVPVRDFVGWPGR